MVRWACGGLMQQRFLCVVSTAFSVRFTVLDLASATCPSLTFPCLPEELGVSESSFWGTNLSGDVGGARQK